MGTTSPITIYLDCTRLIHKSLSLRPSGIERVDINYLNSIILDPDFYPVGFIELVLADKKTNCFFEISNELVKKWIKLCYQKWIVDQIDDERYVESVKKILSNVSAEIKKTADNFERLQQIDKKILKRLRDSDVRPKYLNCTFINIPLGSSHGTLMAQLKMDHYYIIHDLIPIKFPEYVWSDALALEHLNRLEGIAKNKSNIIAISKAVKSDVQSVLKQLGLEVPDIVVINNGVERVFESSFEKEEIIFNNKPKFTYVSTIEPRKNHIFLLNIWRELIEEFGEAAPELHIIGRRGWASEVTYKILSNSPAIKTKVIEHNSLSDEEIVRHLIESRATLFPSFDEGWGLPIVESLSLGVPVICSDIPVHRECSQGFATFISPIDGIGWKNEILKISAEEYIAWTARVEVAKKFIPINWSDSSDKLKAYLKKA